MSKSIELCQRVARAIDHTTWNIPRIRDGARSSTSLRDNNFSKPAKNFSQTLSCGGVRVGLRFIAFPLIPLIWSRQLWTPFF